MQSIMAAKNILVAMADPEEVIKVNEALGDEWLTTPVSSEADALSLLMTGEFDAVMVDFNLGAPDASEFLNLALEKCPDMTRFLFAYEADLALVAAKVLGEPEILPKPVDPDSIRSRIEKVFTGTCAEEGTETGFDNASSIPAVYSEILQALASPEVTCEQVGNMIAQDERLLEVTLMLTRSAYFGLPRNLAEPVAAVKALGLDTIKALVLALQFLAERSHVRPGYLSLEKIWQHSINVAQIARDLVLLETKDRALASQALAAGLLHDLGKIVLASNFDDLYGRVHSLAQKQPVALWDIEREMFGANHGEIGACLLGMWNLPAPIVDAAAHHHEPPLGEQHRLTPLVAVHIANVLEHQLRPTNEFQVVPVVNAPFLNELGLLQRLPVWRAAFANQLSRTNADEADRQNPVAPAAANVSITQTANPPSDSEDETRTATLAPTTPLLGNAIFPSRTRLWVYTGVVAIVMFTLGLSSHVGLGYIQPSRLHAQPPAHQELAMARETAPAIPSVAAPPVVINSEKPTNASPAVSVPVVPEPEPKLAPKVAATATNAIVTPHVPVETKIVAKPLLQLNGILYSASRPAAIVNGKTVFVGEQVDGATVINISQNSVTIEINGKRRTLSVASFHASN